jgi:hypothetical protein
VLRTELMRFRIAFSVAIAAKVSSYKFRPEEESET